MTERLSLRTSSPTRSCWKSVRLLFSDPFAGGRDLHRIAHADLPHVGRGGGRDGDDPQVAQQGIGAEHLFVIRYLPDVEIHLLGDVVHVLKGGDVGEPLLNGSRQGSCHLTRG